MERKSFNQTRIITESKKQAVILPFHAWPEKLTWLTDNFSQDESKFLICSQFRLAENLFKCELFFKCILNFTNWRKQYIARHLLVQKQSSRGVPRKKCSENMHQIYRRRPMPKCDFRHWCSPANLMHIFRTPFPRNTSGQLLLLFQNCPPLLLFSVLKHWGRTSLAHAVQSAIQTWPMFLQYGYSKSDIIKVWK